MCVCDCLVDKGFRVIAADNRGHGGSSKSYDPAFYGKKMVADQIALLDELGIEKCSVAGYSTTDTVRTPCRLGNSNLKFNCSFEIPKTLPFYRM